MQCNKSLDTDDVCVCYTRPRKLRSYRDIIFDINPSYVFKIPFGHALTLSYSYMYEGPWSRDAGSRKNIFLNHSCSSSLFLKSVFNITAHAILVLEFRSALVNLNYYVVSKLARKRAHLQ